MMVGTDTWFYAKRCFLSLVENLAKHMISVRDTVLAECIQFLDHCEIYGRLVTGPYSRSGSDPFA